MNKPSSLRIFTDFDGTISAKDVGASLFNHFSDKRNRGTVKLWMEQKISSRECLWRECSYLKASRSQLIDAANTIGLQPGFREFITFIRANNTPLHILSDGLDFYIEAFLAHAGLGGLDIHANRAHFVNGSLYPSFPYHAAGCGFCGCCKGERIRSLRQHGELTIFIGDGFSDRCALGVADIIFARADLADLCREKSVEYLPFKDFFGVIEYVEKELL